MDNIDYIDMIVRYIKHCIDNEMHICKSYLIEIMNRYHNDKSGISDENGEVKYGLRRVK